MSGESGSQNIDGVTRAEPRKKRAFIGAVLTLLIGAFGSSLWDEYVKSTPKLDGNIVTSSFGYAAEAPEQVRSVVLYLNLRSMREVPVVPVGYRLLLKTTSGWVEAPLDRELLNPGYFRVVFDAKASKEIFGRIGIWTACFPPSSYLLGPGHTGVPINRDAPKSGLLRFRTDLSIEELYRRKGMKLIVKGADNNEYEIDEGNPMKQSDISVIENVEKGTRWVQGNAACGA